jgi:hypothetical protein
MKMVASELLKLAKAVMRTDITFSRSPQAEASKLNLIHYEVSRFVDNVRKNENLSTFVNRIDSKDEMKLEVGLSEHEAVGAIVREITTLAKKLANRNGIEIKD